MMESIRSRIWSRLQTKSRCRSGNTSCWSLRIWVNRDMIDSVLVATLHREILGVKLSADAFRPIYERLIPPDRHHDLPRPDLYTEAAADTNLLARGQNLVTKPPQTGHVIGAGK